MKTCNNCHAELPEDAAVCPNCGAPVDEPAQETPAEEVTEAEAPVEEVTEESVEEPTDELEEETAPSLEKSEKKSNSRLILGIAAVVVVVAAILAVMFWPKSEAPAEPSEPTVEAPQEEPDDTAVTTEPAQTDAHHVNAYGYDSYSIHFELAEDGTYVLNYMDETGTLVPVDEAEVLALADHVIATCGDMELTNRDLLYYYDQQFYTFYSAYSYYIYYFMDPSLALDEQISLDGEQTWQAFFLESALNYFQQTAALYQEAMANGFTVDEETQAMLDGMEADLTDFAVQYGFADAQEYLESYFGPTATVESYLEYLRIGQTASSYAMSLADAIELSDEDIEAYYDENAETIQGSYYAAKVDKNVINVRHILIAPEDMESEDSWTAAEAEAQRIYDEWLAGEATEDSFAELANTYSTDTGSNTNGGLYEEVYPGQMVDAFNDWCFADGRAAGDTGIVETDYGYHIMYFSGEGDYIYWRALAEDLYRSELASQQRMEIAALYDYTYSQTGVVLMDRTAPTVPTVEEATEEAVEEP